MRDLIRRSVSGALLRFVLAGTLNTGVDVALYTALAAAGVQVVVANLISTSCGLVVSYLLNRGFVFRAGTTSTRAGRAKQLVSFVVVTGIGLWLLQPLVIIGATRLLLPLGLPTVAAILVPKLLATAVTLVWNYVLYSLVVFRPIGPAVAAAADPTLGAVAELGGTPTT